MPSGSNSRSARNCGSGWPATRAMSTPWMSEQVLYSHASPGWYSIGMRDSVAIHSSGGATRCGCGGPCFSSLNSGPTAGSEKSAGKPYPARNVSRSATVTGRAAGTTSSTGAAGVRTTRGAASSGSHRATGSSSPIRPSSTSISTAAATIGLVSDAIRKIQSRAIGAVPARSTEPTAAPPGRPARPQQPDKQLRQLLREIDPKRIEATIQKLVSFGTRHTLSSQTDPVRGIGAARDWLLAQFQAIAATSGGRMTVAAQSFVQPVASRIPTPTTITNIVATLQGQATPGRTYVASGHYDSRVTDVMNFTSDAPGADDDGSGVAVALELARLFATRPTEATIVFTTVAGEEQGLYGSAFQAAQYKAAMVDIQGVISNDIVGSSTA